MVRQTMWLIEIGFVFVVCQPFLEGGGNGGTSVWMEGVSHSSNILCYFETAVPCHCVRCWICWFNRHPFHSRLSISPLPVWCLVGVCDSELRRALAIMRYCVTLIRSCPRTTNTITSISVVWYAHSRQLIVWHPTTTYMSTTFVPPYNAITQKAIMAINWDCP